MGKRLKPVQKVEVDPKHFKLRVVLLVVCLLVAVVSIGYGVSQLVNRSSGWQTVEISSDQINCSADFDLTYCFGQDGMSANAEYRQVSALYSQGCEEGYQYFYREGALAKVNAAPNTPVSVPSALYKALELIQTAENRSLYLAPIYDEYDRIFISENEMEAAVYDPGQNSELADYVAQVAVFCNDPQMIDLELMGDDTVCLRISEAYLSFAEEYGIVEFLDFGWMKNAFIADHIADLLKQNGFTHGYLTSYDGFTRNLDDSGLAYSMNVFDRQEDMVNKPAVISYTGPASLVRLRDYPMGDADRWHYFAFSNGHIASVYVDPADGVNKSAVSDLLAYSYEESCAQVLLSVAPVYLSETLEQELLGELASQGIYSVWCAGSDLRYNEETLAVALDSADIVYTKQYIAP